MEIIHSAPDPDQLYDLSADPGERDNLARDAPIAERVAAFRAETARRWNLAALDAEVRESQRRRRVVAAALTKGEAHSWDFQPYRDAARIYVRNTIALDDLKARRVFRRSRRRSRTKRASRLRRKKRSDRGRLRVRRGAIRSQRHDEQRG